MANPLRSIDDLIQRVAAAAKPRQHMVSHESSNLDSILSGMQARDYGMSFARFPHERVPSPLPDEPIGRRGIVYATVAGPGVDYSDASVARLIDNAAEQMIAQSGNTAGLVPAMRDAGVSWVNNWNGIGLAGELQAISPEAVSIRRVFELPINRSYRFPSPPHPQPPARAYSLDDYSQPISVIRRLRTQY
jgi:hypothetical protein